MRKDKDASEHMIVIVIPNVLVGKRDYCLLLNYVNYFKTFELKVPDRQELLIKAK